MSIYLNYLILKCFGLYIVGSAKNIKHYTDYDHLVNPTYFKSKYLSTRAILKSIEKTYAVWG